MEFTENFANITENSVISVKLYRLKCVISKKVGCLSSSYALPYAIHYCVTASIGSLHVTSLEFPLHRTDGIRSLVRQLDSPTVSWASKWDF